MTENIIFRRDKLDFSLSKEIVTNSAKNILGLNAESFWVFSGLLHYCMLVIIQNSGGEYQGSRDGKKLFRNPERRGRRRSAETCWLQPKTVDVF